MKAGPSRPDLPPQANSKTDRLQNLELLATGLGRGIKFIGDMVSERRRRQAERLAQETPEERRRREEAEQRRKESYDLLGPPTAPQLKKTPED